MSKIVFIGPPAAGKGTLSKQMRSLFQIEAVSTGELLREEIERGTEIGKIIQERINQGFLAPLEIVIEVMKEKTKDKTKHFLLDGFPRDLEQATAYNEMLSKTNDQIDLIVYITAPQEVIWDRIRHRVCCRECGNTYHKVSLPPVIDRQKCDDCHIALAKRPDDTEEILNTRMKTFQEKTYPLLQFFRSSVPIVELDGAKPLEDKVKQLGLILESMNIPKF